MVIPAATLLPEPRQSAVYRKYLQLQSIAEKRFSCSLAGRLVLSTGFGLDGAELALATTIAGGTLLGIESDTQKLKAAVRNGACDFMVNTLDEALRVLKNEIRKRTPLSTGLLGSATEILPVLVERGVQPDLIADNPLPEKFALPIQSQQALDQLLQRGAERIAAGNEGQKSSRSEEVLWTASNPQDLRRMDKIALEMVPPGDWVRRRWLEHAAGYFYRQVPLERVLDVSAEERTQLLDEFRHANSSSAFQRPATFHWTGADGVIQMADL